MTARKEFQSSIGAAAGRKRRHRLRRPARAVSILDRRRRRSQAELAVAVMRTAMTVSILDRRRRRSQEGSRACGRGRRCRRFNPRSAPPPSQVLRLERLALRIDQFQSSIGRRRSQAEEVSRAPVPPGVLIPIGAAAGRKVGKPREPLTNEVVSILDRRRRRSQPRRPRLSSRPCPRCFNPRSAPPPVSSFPVEPGTSIACMFQSSIGAAAGRKSRGQPRHHPLRGFNPRSAPPPVASPLHRVLRAVCHLLFQSSIGAAAGRKSHVGDSAGGRDIVSILDRRRRRSQVPDPQLDEPPRRSVSILDRRHRRSQASPAGNARGGTGGFNPRSAPPPVARPLVDKDREAIRGVSILDRRRRRSATVVTLRQFGDGVSILDRRRRRSQGASTEFDARLFGVSLLDRRRRRSQVARPRSAGHPARRFQSSIGAAAGRKSLPVV